MTKITDKKKINIFIAVCCLVYFISYLTRKNYDASMLEIYTSLACKKSLASLASTGSVITYGAGQLLSGVLGDKFKPKNIIFTGLIVTGLCNLALPLSTSIYPMIVIWSINGLAQAMMWPPLVKIMSEALDSENYRKGVLYVTIASSFATILIYLLIPLCIKVSVWKTAFFIASACAVAMSILWMNYMGRFEKSAGAVNAGANKATTDKSPEKAPSAPKGIIFASGLIPIAIAIILQGTLRDGVTTWMPTIVNEVYDFENSLSILSTVALPVVGIFSSIICSAVQKKIRNEVTSSAIFFGVAFAAATLNIYIKNALVCVLLMAIITSCMHGINLMLVCEVPNIFAKYNKVSTISGILNSFTYVGAAISIYGIAFISDKFNNWNINFAIWAVTAAVGLIFCLVVIKKWKNFSKGENVNG